VAIEREIVLPTTPEEAWAVLTDWERQADWMLDADRVEVTSAEREGAGVRLAVHTRVFGLPAFVEPIEVIGWDPPAELRIRHGGAVRGEGAWSLEPVPGGTRFSWTEDVALAVPALGRLAGRLYAPVLRWLMGRAMAGLRASIIARGPVR
jgi:carbon monoxide dehydrogenase subunit G